MKLSNSILIAMVGLSFGPLTSCTKTSDLKCNDPSQCTIDNHNTEPVYVDPYNCPACGLG